MTKYFVTVPYILKIEVPVDTDTKAEAIEKATQIIDLMTITELADALRNDYRFVIADAPFDLYTTVLTEDEAEDAMQAAAERNS